MSDSLKFAKYHGAGNDFVLIDNREKQFPTHKQSELIAEMCARHLGIGADGLILLQLDEQQQLQMIYFNSDGAASSFCGNGSRCFLQFAHELGLLPLQHSVQFLSNDGFHTGTMLQSNLVEVSMKVASQPQQLSQSADQVDTGSPHYIKWCDVLPGSNFLADAQAIRYSSAFAKTGINVNYVRVDSYDQLQIRTYERGVEAETLACGTGVTAAVLSFAERRQLLGNHQLIVQAKGGTLQVRLTRSTQGEFSDVHLIGPAVKVFDGYYAY